MLAAGQLPSLYHVFHADASNRSREADICLFHGERLRILSGNTEICQMLNHDPHLEPAAEAAKELCFELLQKFTKQLTLLDSPDDISGLHQKSRLKPAFLSL